jgi:hypothetical protein
MFLKNFYDREPFENYRRIFSKGRAGGRSQIPGNRPASNQVMPNLGIWHLDYLTPMIPNAVPAGESFPADMRKWVSESLHTIDSNIKHLRNDRDGTNSQSGRGFETNFLSLLRVNFPLLSDTPDYHVEDLIPNKSHGV